MADRIFSTVILLITIGYTVMAFTVIKAPFQYDPLGPEGWPRIVGLVTIPCALFVIAKPDVFKLDANKHTMLRLGTLVLMLFAYAWLYQPAGFIVATFLFCVALSVMLGARIPQALLFGVVTGIVGYFLCTDILELNLPAGLLNLVL